MKHAYAAIILGAVASVCLMSPAPASAQTAHPAGTVQLSPRLALTAKLSEVSFEASTLRDTFDWISTTLGTNVHVDWAALKEAGVEPEHPITLKLKMIGVDRLLRLVLQETGVGDQLTFYVDGNVLEITSKAVADQQLFTRVYPIQDLVLVPRKASTEGGLQSSRNNSGSGGTGNGSIFSNDSTDNRDKDQKSDSDRAQEIVDMIKKVAPPETWEENGGKGTITFFRGNLIVTAPRSVHELIGGPIYNSDPVPAKTASPANAASPAKP